MSGARYNRRDFLKISLAASGLGIAAFQLACNKRKSFNILNADRSSKTAHLLRDGKFPAPSEKFSFDTVIIGGGISGLSAAAALSKNNYTDYVLLDLGEKFGGNAAGGANSVSKYPWAAHYLPIPNAENKELISFLKEEDIIIDFDDKGIPVYREEFLCHAPHERLFIHSRWQQGLVPEIGLGKTHTGQIRSFGKLVSELRDRRDEDGKFYFDIPLHNSSENALKEFDGITFAEFLKRRNFNSEFLLWYLDYCCRDDYGAGIEKVSAFAGLHYFAARRGNAANGEFNAVLTWPEGNEFLAEKLVAKVTGTKKENCLVYSVEKNSGRYFVSFLDSKTGKYFCAEAKHVIFCAPAFVGRRVFKNIASPFSEAERNFEYYPWLIANITVDANKFDPEKEICWDNVIYGSKSLGYVNASHQSTALHTEQIVITYYHALCDAGSKQERNAARSKSDAEWKDVIISNLKKAHPDIETAIQNIEYRLLGHGMICPAPGLITALRNIPRESENIYFAHTDTGGISIFEQAFSLGNIAAGNLLRNISRNA